MNRFYVAMTHDIDMLTLRERGWVSKGNLVLNQVLKGDVTALWHYEKDHYLDSLENLVQMEKDNNIRSTFFVIPHGLAGVHAPKWRASRYNPYQPFLKLLAETGWEIGCHSIDAWFDEQKGAGERQTLEKYYGSITGNRSHWLWLSHIPSKSMTRFKNAGFAYDSSRGYDHKICDVFGPVEWRIAELPVNVQDAAIFGKQAWTRDGEGWRRIKCMNLTVQQAKAVCKPLIERAAEEGKILTVLLHSNNFCPLFDLTGFYGWMIDTVRENEGWIGPAKECIGRHHETHPDN